MLSTVGGEHITVLERDGPGGRRTTPDRDRLAHARILSRQCRDFGAALWISGAPEIATLVDADGLQLPERGLRPDDVRAVWAGACGRSCHDAAGLKQATSAGAAWAVLAPFFAPISKASTTPALGPSRWAELAAATPLPVIAVGGIAPGRVAACRRAGAAGVATMGAVFLSADPVATVRNFLSAWNSAAVAVDPAT